MPIIDLKGQIIHFKIVYYGPVAAGKASSLRYLHTQFGSAVQSTLDSSSANEVHTVSVVCIMSSQAAAPGYTVQLYLTTKSGAMLHEAARTIDLQDADGIVFVADSQRLKLGENIRKLREMAQGLRHYGRSIRHLPIILQYNKRDLSPKNISSITEMDSYLNPVPWPRVLTVADHYANFEGSWKAGHGVMETFQILYAQMCAKIKLGPDGGH